MAEEAKQYHHSGLRYVGLKLAATLLRTLAGAAASKETAKALANLPDDVTRTRKEIPSRDKGRTVTVDVYESSSSSQPGPKPVLLNFHGSPQTSPAF